MPLMFTWKLCPAATVKLPSCVQAPLAREPVLLLVVPIPLVPLLQHFGINNFTYGAAAAGAGAGLFLIVFRFVAAGQASTHAADLARELANSAATAFFFSVIAALGVGIVAAGIKKQALRSELLLAVLAGIVALDLSRANLAAYHTGPVEAATFIPPLAEALQAREGPLKPGRFRVFTIQRNTFTPPWHVRSVMGPYGASSVLRRQALDLEHNAEFNIEAVKPYLPAHSSKLASMLMATIAQRVGAEVAARFNVTYSIGRGAHLEDRRACDTRHHSHSRRTSGRYSEVVGRETRSAEGI